MEQNDYPEKEDGIKGETTLNRYEHPQRFSYPLYRGGDMPASEDQANHVRGDQQGDIIIDVAVEDLKG